MNNLFGISAVSYAFLIKTFEAEPQVEEVILFGSRATGKAKKGSDIDLAIKGKNCSAGLALDLKALINEKLPVPYMVDVVNYGSLQHPDLIKHIDGHGILFYQRGVPMKKTKMDLNRSLKRETHGRA